MIGQFSLCPESCTCVFANLFDPFLGKIAVFLAHGAHGALQMNRGRNDVVGFRGRLDGRDGNHFLFNRISVAADDCLQCRDDVRGYYNRVNALVGFGGVRPATANFNIDLISSCKERTRTNCKLTGGNTRPIVHAIDFLDVPSVHHAIVAHLFAATAALFGRLEDHRDRAVEIACFCEVLCSTQ